MELAEQSEYDLIILDYVLPGIDGKEVCLRLRKDGVRAPILMLTVKNETLDKVAALDVGMDDYLTKPFSMDELRARVRALLRRPQQLLEDTFKVDDLVFNVHKQQAYRGNKEIYLTRKEAMLLEYLLRNRGIVLSRYLLLEHVWGSDVDPLTNSIEMHIMNLRKKIDSTTKRKLIHTIPGRGYTLDLR